jgi:hypothetical protein
VRAEEERRAAEEQRVQVEKEGMARAEEERRAAEEQRVQVEKEQIVRAEEERRAAEEQRVQVEKEGMARAEEEQRAAEEQRVQVEKEQMVRAEEERRAAEEQRLQVEKEGMARAEEDAHRASVREWHESWEAKLREFRAMNRRELKADGSEGGLNGPFTVLAFLELLHSSCSSFYSLGYITIDGLEFFLRQWQKRGARRYAGGYLHVPCQKNDTAEKEHFTALLIDGEAKKAEYFDSLGSSGRGLDDAVRKILLASPLVNEVVHTRMVHQTGNRECGVYVCYYLKERLLRAQFGASEGTSVEEFEEVRVPDELMAIKRDRLFAIKGHPLENMPAPFPSPYRAAQQSREGIQPRIEDVPSAPEIQPRARIELEEASTSAELGAPEFPPKTLSAPKKPPRVPALSSEVPSAPEPGKEQPPRVPALSSEVPSAPEPGKEQPPSAPTLSSEVPSEELMKLATKAWVDEKNAPEPGKEQPPRVPALSSNVPSAPEPGKEQPPRVPALSSEVPSAPEPGKELSSEMSAPEPKRVHPSSTPQPTSTPTDVPTYRRKKKANRPIVKAVR